MSDNRIPLERDTVVGRHFKILNLAGKGSFGLIYKAKDIKNGKIVAVKEFYPEIFSPQNNDKNDFRSKDVRINPIDKYHIDSMLGEAISQEKISHHPSIAQMLYAFPENNSVYIVMEWINGAPISFVSSIIKKYKKSLCEYFFGKIFYEIISGIIYIYENKLTHRDISPNNVMIEFDKKIIDGSAKLIDFGSVGFMDKYRVQSQYSRVGTSLFMAPEDSGTKSEFGPWSDLYSAAMTMLYAICPNEFSCKEDIFEAQDIAVVIKKYFTNNSNLAKALELALQHDYKKRWQDFGEIISLLPKGANDKYIGNKTKATLTINDLNIYHDIRPDFNRYQRCLLQTFDTARFQRKENVPQIKMESGALLESDPKSKIALARAEALINFLLGREIIVPAGQVADSPAFMCIFYEVVNAYNYLVDNKIIPQSLQWRPFRLALEQPEWNDYAGFVKNYKYTGAPTVILADSGNDAKEFKKNEEIITDLIKLFAENEFKKLGENRPDTKHFYGIDYGVFAKLVKSYFKRDVSVFKHRDSFGNLSNDYASVYRGRVFDETVTGNGLDIARGYGGLVNHIEEELASQECGHLRGNWYLYAKKFQEAWPLIRGYFDSRLFLSLASQYNVDHISLISQELEYGKFDHSLVLGPRFSNNFFESDNMAKLYSKIKTIFPDSNWSIDWIEIISIYSNEKFVESVKAMNRYYYENDIETYAELLAKHVEIVNEIFSDILILEKETGALKILSAHEGEKQIIHASNEPVLLDTEYGENAKKNALSYYEAYKSMLTNKLDVRLLLQQDSILFYSLKPYKMVATICG